MASTVPFKATQKPMSRNQDKTEEFLHLFSTIRSNGISGKRLTVEENISRFLTFYEQNKGYIDQKEAKRIMFFELPHICFENHIGNGDLVADVLRIIHRLPHEGVPHLVLFLSMLCLDHERLSGEVLQRRTESGLCSFSKIAYFLHHAQMKRLTFGQNRRLTDLVVDANPKLYSRIMLFGDVRSVRSLVQFGLKFQLPDEAGSRVHPLFLQAAEIMSWFIKKTRLWQRNGKWEKTDHQKDHNNLQTQQMSSFTQNLKLLLEATANPFEITSQIIYILPLWSGLKDLKRLKPYMSLFFPYSGPEVYRPPPLKHLCRHVVRSRLHDNWCLPHGLWNLPVSREMRAYLNYSSRSNK